ncbi:MAG TPA: hypothetical protein VLN72_10135, partial [Gillisia sp.]|nr:hypothetical protein [Gillisia sp.]
CSNTYDLKSSSLGFIVSLISGQSSIKLRTWSEIIHIKPRVNKNRRKVVIKDARPFPIPAFSINLVRGRERTARIISVNKGAKKLFASTRPTIKK